MELGFTADDFKSDIMTLKGVKRAALLVRTTDTNAFLKCTNITNAKTALTAGS
jgi:hypothetical protein